MKRYRITEYRWRTGCWMQVRAFGRADSPMPAADGMPKRRCKSWRGLLREPLSGRQSAEDYAEPMQASDRSRRHQLPNVEARYRALVEQIPAVVFMAYLDEASAKLT